MADLLLLGDIDVVDTWKDIKLVLANQMKPDSLVTQEQSNGSSTGANLTSSSDESGVSPRDDLTSLDIAEVSGAPPSQPDNAVLTPEDRGIFTRGQRRKYSLRGSAPLPRSRF